MILIQTKLRISVCVCARVCEVYLAPAAFDTSVKRARTDACGSILSANCNPPNSAGRQTCVLYVFAPHVSVL